MIFNVVFLKVQFWDAFCIFFALHIVKKFNLSCHFYADDSQLYLSFQPTIPGDREIAVSNIERCVLEIDNWMLVNRLKLNKDKTAILVTYLC